MDDPTSTPTQQQKRPRVAEENRKRAVRAYADPPECVGWEPQDKLDHSLTRIVPQM